MTLDEASFYVAATLNEIAAREGRAMHITDIHSVVRTHGGQVSIYLDVDPPGVDCGVGGESCIIVLVDERAVLDMNQAELLRALTNDGCDATKH
ncbi:MAG: hypothetical protein WA592_18360 [Pseudolabrys sp.]|jgi:hypothetical protein